MKIYVEFIIKGKGSISHSLQSHIKEGYAAFKVYCRDIVENGGVYLNLEAYTFIPLHKIERIIFKRAE